MILNKLLINLQRRPDRLKRFKNEYKLDDFKIINGFDGSSPSMEEDADNQSRTKNISAGDMGCVLSHIRCYEYIIKNNLEYTLIFEDDAHFCDDFNEKLKNVYNEYKSNVLSDINILYIGGRFKPNHFTDLKNCSIISDNLIKHNFYDNQNDWNVKWDLDRTTHAYIISKFSAAFLLKTFYTGIVDLPIDHWVVKSFHESKYDIYSAQPLLCWSEQHADDSDIRGNGLKYSS
jgi:GR25 family glycosyltransferase involved in LPS biosynthesis